MSKMKIKLPKPVADIYRAVDELKRRYPYPGLHFTLDGHLPGDLAVALACEAFSTIKPHAAGYKWHDARCSKRGDVQIKITATNHVALPGPCKWLMVFKIISPEEAELVYDGSGVGLWEKAGAGKTASNGQRRLSLTTLSRVN
jgi:hypothetical protein